MFSELKEHFDHDTQVLKQLISLLWEKTINLERIQGTYDEDVKYLRERIVCNEDQISSLRDEIAYLKSKLGKTLRPHYDSEEDLAPDSPKYCRKTPSLSLLKKQETLEGTITEVRDVKECFKVRRAECSLTSEASRNETPLSPGLSKSLQDVFSQLDFLNDRKAIKISSASSASADEVFVNENLSFDTSIYNESVNTSNSSLYEPGMVNNTLTAADFNFMTGKKHTSSQKISDSRSLSSRNGINHFSVSSQKTDSSPTSPLKPVKKREVIIESVISKLPIVLQNTSDSDEYAEIVSILKPQVSKYEQIGFKSDNFITHPEGNEVPSDEVLSEHSPPVKTIPHHLNRTFFEHDWTRSDTFEYDVMPDNSIPQSYPPSDSTETDTSPPPKPKRRLIRPQFWNNGEQCTSENSVSTFSSSCCGSSIRSNSIDYEVQYITPQMSSSDECANNGMSNQSDSCTNLSLHELKCQVTPVNSLQSDPTPVNSPPPNDKHRFDLDQQNAPLSEDFVHKKCTVYTEQT